MALNLMDLESSEAERLAYAADSMAESAAEDEREYQAQQAEELE